MRESDAWSDIPKGPSPGSRTEKRADPDHPLDFYRGRDDKGHYLLILKGPELPRIERLPVLGGLKISMGHWDDRPDELIVELLDDEQLSIFKALVTDILLSTEDIGTRDAPAGARRLITRIERWQDLLKRRKEQVLSRQAIIGLVGELFFLKHWVMPNVTASHALAAWRGPYKDEQDFAVSDTIFEIKTQLSTVDQFLNISSEAQLDTTSGPIVLCHQTVASVAETEPRAFSLNGLIANIRTTLLETSPSSIDLLESGLIAAGYDERPEYDHETWLAIRLRAYEVMEDFPRLVPSTLPAGIQKVSYRILPNACAKHVRDDPWLKEVLNGRRS